MQGEALNGALLSERGILGDRALALLDVETGKVASAKSPRMWPNLLDFHATFVEPPRAHEPLPPVRITLPGGEYVLNTLIGQSWKIMSIARLDWAAIGY
jgi:hypothetical protein